MEWMYVFVLFASVVSSVGSAALRWADAQSKGPYQLSIRSYLQIYCDGKKPNGPIRPPPPKKKEEEEEEISADGGKGYVH
jgi:hypothetical protein